MSDEPRDPAHGNASLDAWSAVDPVEEARLASEPPPPSAQPPPPGNGGEPSLPSDEPSDERSEPPTRPVDSPKTPTSPPSPPPLVTELPEARAPAREPPPGVLPPLEEVVFEPRGAPPGAQAAPARSSEPVAPGRPVALSRRRFRTLVALGDALLPRGGGIEPSASDLGVASLVDGALAAGDPEARRLVSRALGAWEWSSLFTRGVRPFSRLSPPARAASVARAERGRGPRRRVLEVLKIYVVNEWASTAQVEAAIGYTYGCLSGEPPREGATLEILQWPTIGRDHVEECDAVVIGSGAGGAVVAKELAEAGMSVVVLEEGGSFTRSDFAGPPWRRFQRFYRAGGATFALGSPPMPIPMGKAVGGTTLVNAGTCFRTPDRVLARWGSEFGIEEIDAAAMAPYFERVERVLRVKPVPEELLGRNAEVFRRGVNALGLHGAPLLRNIEGCRGCGVCAFGCPSDAKQSTHLSYLPRAQHHGATIYAHARAERIVIEGGRAAGVVATLMDPATSEPRAELRVRAGVVVLAAGAIHTPALLAANALANRSGMLGRNLRVHPAAGVGAIFEEDVTSWKGTLQSYMVDEWHESNDVMIEVTSSIPSTHAGAFPGAGAELKDLLAGYRHIATSGLFVSDTGSGRVVGRAGREPLIAYRLDKSDARKMVRGIGAIAEIFLAAGARTVLTGVRAAPTVSSREELERLRDVPGRPSDLHLTGFHPVGTARMGADPATCVLGQDGEVHGVGGLYVADASMLPGCPSVNPMVTIMAFATRTAARIAAAASGA